MKIFSLLTKFFTLKTSSFKIIYYQHVGSVRIQKKRMSTNCARFPAVIATTPTFFSYLNTAEGLLRILSSIIKGDQCLEEKDFLKMLPSEVFIFHISSDFYYKIFCLHLFMIFQRQLVISSQLLFRTSIQIKGKIFEEDKDREGLSYFQNNLCSFTLTIDIESYFHLLSHN